MGNVLLLGFALLSLAAFTGQPVFWIGSAACLALPILAFVAGAARHPRKPGR